MKREIEMLKGAVVSDCCPGHDTYPVETYRNRRSKKARSRDKQIEHQHARSIQKQNLQKEIDLL
jgi:hypothetical protein